MIHEISYKRCHSKSEEGLGSLLGFPGKSDAGTPFLSVFFELTLFKSHLPQIMSRAKSSAFCLQKYRRTLVLARKSVPYFLQMERNVSFFLFGEYCEMSKSAALRIPFTYFFQSSNLSKTSLLPLSPDKTPARPRDQNLEASRNAHSWILI